MTFRIRIRALGSPLAVAALLVSASAAVADGGWRETSRMKIVKRSHNAVIYNDKKRGGALRAHLDGQPRAYRLAQRGTVVPSRPLALAGRFVAYEQITPEDHHNGDVHVAVRDLRNGKLHRKAYAYESGKLPGVEDPYPVRSLVLKRNGSIAWVSVRDDSVAEVWRLNHASRATAVKLDEVDDVGAYYSLRLRDGGREIVWRHGDEMRSAPIN